MFLFTCASNLIIKFFNYNKTISDSLIENNNCTYIGTTFKGRHDSDEYLGAVQIRETALSLTVNPGV